MGGHDVLKDAIPAVSVRAQDDAAATVVHVLQVDDVAVARGLAAAGAAHLDGEAFLAHGFGFAVAPLDDGDGLVEGGVEVEGLQVAEVRDAVGVRVDEVRPSAKGGVDAGDDEGRGSDAPAHAHADADALCEGRLACSEPAREHDEVPGYQHAPEIFAERARLVGVAGVDDVGGDGLISHERCSPGSRWPHRRRRGGYGRPGG